MAEDPEGIRRRVDQQQLRRQLNEVFGPFDQFAEYVSGSGSSGPNAMMRHGVVQIPTTPVVSSRSRLPVGGSSSPINQQSTQQLLQSMQNLVTSPPIQPIQLCTPFTLKKDYLNTEPSSSTRSVVESNDTYNIKKKRKSRAVNSDSETDRERDKRKRTRDCSNDRDNTANVGTSRGRRSTEDERLRALFGEDGDEDRKEPPDKPVSPDSGVHSTENDPGDENDISAQNILSMITKLSPPLSPIRLRPKDKKTERGTQEKENREKEERNRRELERREKEQREKEATERKEQERKEREDREKKEKEIAERKGQERKEKEEREKRERDEKEKREKEQEERERKEKERQEIDRREKEQKDKDEKERRRAERERKEEVARDSKTGLRGEIALRGLNPSRLNQLLELGKKTGKVKDIEKKELRREKERKEDKEKKKERKDREKRRESETDIGKKGYQEMVDMKIEPRPSSSHSQDAGDVSKEFKCVSSECCPVKAVRPEKPEPESTEKLCDFYQSVARVRKRKADGESDKVQRILLYLDCVVYFTLSAKHFQTSDGTENKASRQVTILRDTCELLKLVTQHFTKQSDNISPLHHHLMSRVRNLSLRIQAVLAYHLYNFRSQQVFKAYTVLTQMDPHVIEEKKADATPSAGGGKTTPSPSSSVHSNSNQGVNTISMPTHVYQLQKQQLKTLHHLMLAHRIWGEAAERAGGNIADMTFITSLEKICGHLCVDAPLEKMSLYLLTGVSWLRTEYEREKRRPPPPISAKRLS